MVLTLGLPLVFCGGFLVFYFQSDMPAWALLLVGVITFIIVVSSLKTKLIIEENILRYEKVFGWDEVSLDKVSQIIMREVETIVEKDPSSSRDRQRKDFDMQGHRVNEERQVEKIIYVLDESGRTYFSFPARMIGLRNRTRFKEVIHGVNPNIEVF